MKWFSSVMIVALLFSVNGVLSMHPKSFFKKSCIMAALESIHNPVGSSNYRLLLNFFGRHSDGHFIILHNDDGTQESYDSRVPANWEYLKQQTRESSAIGHWDHLRRYHSVRH